jgi:hypothetical protein
MSVTPRHHNMLSRVDELLDPTTGHWEEELVRHISIEEDAKIILSIPMYPD